MSLSSIHWVPLQDAAALRVLRLAVWEFAGKRKILELHSLRLTPATIATAGALQDPVEPLP